METIDNNINTSNSNEVTETNPYLAAVYRKYRNLKKKYEKIVKIELKLSSGSKLNEEQIAVLSTKSSVEKSLSDIHAVKLQIEEIANELALANVKDTTPINDSLSLAPVTNSTTTQSDSLDVTEAGTQSDSVHTSSVSTSTTTSAAIETVTVIPEVVNVNEMKANTDNNTSTTVDHQEQFLTAADVESLIQSKLHKIFKALHVCQLYQQITGEELPISVQYFGNSILGLTSITGFKDTLNQSLRDVYLYIDDKLSDTNEVINKLTYSEMSDLIDTLAGHLDGSIQLPSTVSKVESTSNEIIDPIVEETLLIECQQNNDVTSTAVDEATILEPNAAAVEKVTENKPLKRSNSKSNQFKRNSHDNAKSSSKDRNTSAAATESNAPLVSPDINFYGTPILQTPLPVSGVIEQLPSTGPNYVAFASQLPLNGPIQPTVPVQDSMSIPASIEAVDSAQQNHGTNAPIDRRPRRGTYEKASFEQKQHLDQTKVDGTSKVQLSSDKEYRDSRTIRNRNRNRQRHNSNEIQSTDASSHIETTTLLTPAHLGVIEPPSLPVSIPSLPVDAAVREDGENIDPSANVWITRSKHQSAKHSTSSKSTTSSAAVHSNHRTQFHDNKQAGDRDRDNRPRRVASGPVGLGSTLSQDQISQPVVVSSETAPVSTHRPMQQRPSQDNRQENSSNQKQDQVNGPQGRIFHGRSHQGSQGRGTPGQGHYVNKLSSRPGSKPPAQQPVKVSA